MIVTRKDLDDALARARALNAEVAEMQELMKCRDAMSPRELKIIAFRAKAAQTQVGLLMAQAEEWLRALPPAS